MAARNGVAILMGVDEVAGVIRAIEVAGGNRVAGLIGVDVVAGVITVNGVAGVMGPGADEVTEGNGVAGADGVAGVILAYEVTCLIV